MKASLRSYRLSPRKANLIAKMIRGMTVEEALSTLERTHKKAARVLDKLIKSAIANAQHNDNQNPENLVIKSLIVNQAQVYHRSIPMARGRVRPIRKFLSHIELTLGVAEAEEPKSSQKEVKTASQSPEKKVKNKGSDKSAESGKGSSKKKTAPAPKVSAEQDSSPSKK